MLTDVSVAALNDEAYRTMTGLSADQFEYIYVNYCSTAPLQTRSPLVPLLLFSDKWTMIGCFGLFHGIQVSILSSNALSAEIPNIA
jgi:hypothetical protein